MEYKKIDDKELILNFIRANEMLLPEKISDRIPLKEYVNKLIKNGLVICAIENMAIVGLIAGYCNDTLNKQSYVSLILVNNNFQNQHIGNKLLFIFENYSIKNGMLENIITTSQTNHRAIKFYEKNDYKKIKIVNDRVELSKKLKVKILLTSVGRRGYLVDYFIEILGKDNVYISNSSDVSPAFTRDVRSVITPLIYEENYIDFLLEYCLQYHINLVISLFDIDLYILAQNKTLFECFGITVVVSDIKTLDICNDKYNTYMFLKKNGFNVKNTYITLEDAVKAINENIIRFPLIIKPRWGMGSIAILEADNLDELKVLYNKVLNSIKNSYLKYESAQDIEKSILIQEKICGQEYGLDVINDLNSCYQNTIVRKKIAMRAGETDCAVLEKDLALKELGMKISQKLNHIGNLDVDVLIENNQVYILEFNARFGGGYPFSHISGVNLPMAIIKWVKNERFDKTLLEEKEYNQYLHKDLNLVKLKKYSND